MKETEETEAIPSAFRVLLDEEQEGPAEIVVTHKLEFRARVGRLGWRVAMIADVRRKMKVPDSADLKVSKSLVVFTWSHKWTDPPKADRRKP